MDFPHYLEKFKGAAGQLDRKLFDAKQIEIKTGIWLDSVVLKLQKKTWANSVQELFQPGPSIFFSVWLNDQSIKESRLLYNIHALKLRQLKGYAIASRDFATAFRKKFKKMENKWPNVSTSFGPATLMEGWVPINEDAFQKDIPALANRFLEIEYLIDDVLDSFRKIPKGKN